MGADGVCACACAVCGAGYSYDTRGELVDGFKDGDTVRVIIREAEVFFRANGSFGIYYRQRKIVQSWWNRVRRWLLLRNIAVYWHALTSHLYKPGGVGAKRDRSAFEREF